MRSLMFAACLAGLVPLTASAEAVPGQPAPAFSAPDASGKPVSLADLKGRYVVLEWTNPDCPFVRKHYGGGHLPGLHKQAAARGVTWVSIQSVAASEADRARRSLSDWQREQGAAPALTLIDADAGIARRYRARTTPHLYVIDPKGVVIYAGAIDSKPSANPADIPGATNYVVQALDEAMAGKPVSRPSTTAYGCAIKYPTDA